MTEGRPVRCAHCGRERGDAAAARSAFCAPPFTVQPHRFDGTHPADWGLGPGDRTTYRVSMVGPSGRTFSIGRGWGRAEAHGYADLTRLLNARGDHPSRPNGVIRVILRPPLSD